MTCRFTIPGPFTVPRYQYTNATVREHRPGLFGGDADIECDTVKVSMATCLGSSASEYFQIFNFEREALLNLML